MSTILLDLKTRVWSATELRCLSPEARDAILFAAAQLADSDYRHDERLTAFEAFGEAICMVVVAGSTPPESLFVTPMRGFRP